MDNLREEQSDDVVYVRDPYVEWANLEGVPVVGGFHVNLFDVETAPWNRIGTRGAIVKLQGSGDFLDLWLWDIPPTGESERTHFLCEQLVYVLEGQGSVRVEAPQGTYSFEWKAKSLFTIPLNAHFQVFNGSGRARALLAVTTDMPLIMNLFHNEDLIFNSDIVFSDRFGDEAWYEGKGIFLPKNPDVYRRSIWETNFIPDLGAFDRVPANDERGMGSKTVEFILGNNTMHAHMSEIPARRYKKAHRHEAGFHIFPVSGQGYSLLWIDDPHDFQRIDWQHGHVYAPPEQWWHQHFNLGAVPSRYLATFLGSNRYPLTQERKATYSGQPELRRGGGQIEPSEELPDIYNLFEKELGMRGLTPEVTREMYYNHV